MRQKDIVQAFNAADSIGAGLLDSDAIAMALEMLQLPGVDKLPIADWVAAEGHEGYVDLDGFKAIVHELVENPSPSSSSSSHQRVQEVFRMLSNGRGAITLESLRQASQEEDWSLQELQEMMNEADANHDGVVDLHEFRRVWERAGMS